MRARHVPRGISAAVALGVSTIVIVAIIIAGRTVWGDYFISPAYSHKFLLTINVRVQGKLQTGSTIIEVRTSIGPDSLRALNSLGEAPKARGEALYIDLGEYGALVMTLHSTSGCTIQGMAFDAFTGYPQKISDRITALENLEHLKKSKNVTPDHLCQFVWFPDKNNRETLRLVDPNSFHRVINPAIEFDSAEISMTDDPISVGIEHDLPWLREMKPTDFVGSPQLGIEVEDFLLRVKP